jgi:redox-sensitive bicupin YhaK (pirin superfamily)
MMEVAPATPPVMEGGDGMPAKTVKDLMVLPRVVAPAAARERPVSRRVAARSLLEGAGFPVHRPFPGPGISLRETDPFLLLDQMGAVDYGPGEAKGAPWHPHRGFETVTYMLDGTMRHQDSMGGGGVIRDGATQWMTAGSGILHDEMPPEELVRTGGLFHGVQLWVNLPRRLKWTPPRYQGIEPDAVRLLASEDGAALIRLIAGRMGGYDGPGNTWTPIDYAHASIAAGGRMRLPWRAEFNAMAYVLAGAGTAGTERVAVQGGALVLFGPGEAITLAAAAHQDQRTTGLEVLLLGGQPIHEPVYHYGPFVMNSHEELVQAFEDYRSGRLGTVPATVLTPSVD